MTSGFRFLGRKGIPREPSHNGLIPHFDVGEKQIFLPSFRIALIRTPNLPPIYAKFQVPLTFTKLDLRDYLFHAYNLRVRNVRSFVQQQKVTMGKEDDVLPNPKLHRKKAKKFMTVEMEKPFVWPEEPTDFQLWDKKILDSAELAQKKEQENRGIQAKMKIPEEAAKAMREHAEALLKGRERWKE